MYITTNRITVISNKILLLLIFNFFILYYTSFAAAFLADSFLNYALTGSAWMTTIKITTIALNTGACAEDTPNAYNVVVIA